MKPRKNLPHALGQLDRTSDRSQNFAIRSATSPLVRYAHLVVAPELDAFFTNVKLGLSRHFSVGAAVDGASDGLSVYPFPFPLLPRK